MADSKKLTEHAQKIAAALMAGKYPDEKFGGMDYEDDEYPEVGGYGGNFKIADFYRAHKVPILIVGAVVVVALAGGIGLYMYNKNKKKQ
jgi:hypothetical protein